MPWRVLSAGSQTGAKELTQGSALLAVAQLDYPAVPPQEPPVSSGPAYDTKEQIKQAIDLVDLVGGSLQLRRQGRHFVGLCPWHDDSKPSLHVNPERQSWKCWVCDIGGDIFDFTMRREGVDFREALQMLADRAGIELRRMAGKPVKPGSANDKHTLYRAVSWSEDQFHKCLLQSPDAELARRYLEDRGITPASVEKFHIGFAPDKWQWLLDRAKTTPFSPAILEAVGLIAKGESGQYYERFRGRIVFPIRDTQRRPIAFGGRIQPHLAAKQEAEGRRPLPKYVNSPETRLFAKSQQLYGLDVARDAVSKSRHVVVFEGYTDVVMGVQAGLDNVTAVLGTALGEAHIRLLSRFADTITLVLDGDEAGQRRTNEILELFVAADRNLRILTLPAGLDPCDFLLEHGAEPFRTLCEGALDAVDHKIATETRGIDLARDTHGANHALEGILSTIAKSPRQTSASQLREQQVLGRLSRKFHIDESQIRARLSDLRQKTKRPARPQENEQGSLILSLSSLERELLEILTLEPALTVTAIENIPPQWLESQSAQGIYTVYERLAHDGEPCEVKRVMTALDDSRLKNLLVTIDETAKGDIPLWDSPGDRRSAAKHSQAQEPADARLQRLIEDFEAKRLELQQRSKLAALEERQLDEKEELDVLEDLINQERDRQGISTPTDG